MLRILEAQAPAKQTATDTINTLSSRLSSATLLEDRRAAILGLRSFAKGYPASVASGALRDLLAALRRDGEDSDTTKVVLETLLMLFEPDEQSPEASEEITLWLADEFIQRQDNITALLDFLETGEFYLRLYSLQILSHICAARPLRSHEAVLAAPLGVSRITAVLDDRREAVRNEALLLLVALTPASAELQKVVAFENAFDRVFMLVEKEGGLTHGSTTVQDCLSLLANLLTLNPSNQAYFREMGCLAKVSKLLFDAIREVESPDGVADWVLSQRDMNLWGILAVVQLFLAPGSQGTAQAQLALWQTKVLDRVLQIAFDASFATNVRSKSLETCGAIIRGNPILQEQFGDLAVVRIKQSEKSTLTNGHRNLVTGNKPSSGAATPAPVESSNVIEALLELALEPASVATFEVRLAACNCMKAFMDGHKGIRGHVLHRAIEGHKSGNDSIPNMLDILLEPSSARSTSDPYQVWMASVLLLHLLYDDSDTKTMALEVSEGNAEDGEEVVTFVQSLTSNIVAGVQHVDNERALIGYLMLLSTWLYEDPEAVNDLLGEGSNVQGLIAAVKVSSASMPLVSGLCAVLLGIVYEFATKDSPIPRSTLHGVLSKTLTREVYIDRLTKLRESRFVRDFEVLPAAGNGGLPDVYFDKTFMDFLKDNFSRLLRAIDRDPSFEASIVANGIQKGVSRELVDSLRADLEEQRRLFESVQTEMLQLRQRLEQEELEHRRTRESTSVELGRIKQINQSLQRNQEDEVNQLQQSFQTQIQSLTTGHESTLAQLKREHLAAVEDSSQRHQAEKKYLEQRQSGHERELTRVRETLATQHKAEIEQVRSEASNLQERVTLELQQMKSDLASARSEEISLRAQLASAEKSLEAAQSESLKLNDKFQSQTQKVQQDYSEKIKSAETRAQDADRRATSFEEQAQQAERRSAVLEAQIKTAAERVSDAENRAKKAEDELKKVKDHAVRAAEQKSPLDQDPDALQKALAELKISTEKTKDVQTELDDLLVVFADLEAKRAEDKKRLRELGEEVSDDEADDDVADDGADEDEDEDVD